MSAGVKHDSGKVPMELLSTKALIEIARVMDFGKKKYTAHNWRGGLAWSRVLGAAIRHISAFNDGQDKDPETGLSHIAHASCCLMFLLEYEQTHKELDDRYREKPLSVVKDNSKEMSHPSSHGDSLVKLGLGGSMRIKCTCHTCTGGL